MIFLYVYTRCYSWSHGISKDLVLTSRLDGADVWRRFIQHGVFCVGSECIVAVDVRFV